MSLSMSDMVRFQALEVRVAELEKKLAEFDEPSHAVRFAALLHAGIPDGSITPAETPFIKELRRRGRPPKNLEERMKAQEHDPIDAE